MKYLLIIRYRDGTESTIDANYRAMCQAEAHGQYLKASLPEIECFRVKPVDQVAEMDA